MCRFLIVGLLCSGRGGVGGLLDVLVQRRLEVKYLYEEGLDALGVDFQKQLDVRVVEPVQVVQAANQVEVGTPGLAAIGAHALQVPPQQEVVGVLVGGKAVVF